jgi:solute carrier family 45 protein 1/2/4
MTGGAYMPPTEYDDDLERASGHSVQWVGTPGVKGPSWARLPLLTVGMLGTQVVWSIEMGYGEYKYTSRGSHQWGW